MPQEHKLKSLLHLGIFTVFSAMDNLFKIQGLFLQTHLRENVGTGCGFISQTPTHLTISMSVSSLLPSPNRLYKFPLIPILTGVGDKEGDPFF